MPLTKSFLETLPVPFGSSLLNNASAPIDLRAGGKLNESNADWNCALLTLPVPLASTWLNKFDNFCPLAPRPLAPETICGFPAPEIMLLIFLF
jgi:hypothetical protein